MKKFIFYAFSMLFVLSTLSSCSDETEVDPDKPKPSLTVTELTKGITNNAISVEAGTNIVFRWNAVKAGGGRDLQSFTIAQQGANVLSPLPKTTTGRDLPLTSLPNSIETQYIDTLLLPAGNNLGVTVYTFTVTDKEGLSTAVTVSVTVVEGETALDNEANGQFFHVNGSLKGAFDLLLNQEVGASDPDAGKDLANTDAAGSPFTGSFESKNGTQFVKANSYDYENATLQSATAAFDAGTASSSVTNPAADDIYIVKLRGQAAYVVLKVTSVDPADNECACTNTGKIAFSYKY